MDCAHSEQNINAWNIEHVFFITPRFEALLNGKSYNKKTLSWSTQLTSTSQLPVYEPEEEELAAKKEQELVDRFPGTNGVSLSVGNMHSVPRERSPTTMTINTDVDGLEETANTYN